jgi:hypothetical protein
MIKRIGLALVATILTLPLAGLAPTHADSPSGLRFKQLSAHCSPGGGHCRQRQVDREQLADGGVAVYFQHRDWRGNAYGSWSRWHLRHVLVPCATGLCRQRTPGGS